MIDLYLNVELPLADVLYQMEVSGFKVDYEALCQTGEKYRETLANLDKEFHALVGEEGQTTNINSLNSKRFSQVRLTEMLKSWR